MVDDIDRFMQRWLPRMEEESRSYITIAIGCTGGQHRSVYVVERLAQRLKENTNCWYATVKRRTWRNVNLNPKIRGV